MYRPLRPGSTGFVLLIAMIMAMTAMSIDINLPAIEIIADDLDSSLASSQLTVTMFFIGFAVGQAICGSASDRFGRKPVMLVGMGLFVLASIACAVAPSMGTLHLMRVAQGLTAAAGSVLGRAVVRDLFRGTEMARVMSFAMAAFIIVPMIAPTFGAGILAAFGSWRGIFVFLALYGLTLFALVLFRLEESLKAPDPRALDPSRLLGAWRAVLSTRQTLVYGGAGVLVSGCLVCYLTNSPVVFLTIYGMSPGHFGLMFGVVALCAAFGNLTNARLVRRFALRRLVWLGMFIALVSLGGALLVRLLGIDSPWAVLPGFCGFFFGFGFVLANGTTLAMQPHGHIVGTASAAVGVIQAVFPALVGSLAAYAFDGTTVPMLAIMTSLILLGMGLLLLAPSTAPERH